MKKDVNYWWLLLGTALLLAAAVAVLLRDPRFVQPHSAPVAAEDAP